jgi:undecaprenyl phosphate-alpha-L-ara4FN deformylase
MSKVPAAIRIDVDTVKDVLLLPKLLDLLKSFDIKATFFVSTGPDKTGLNVVKYLKQPQNYTKFLKSKPLRYGIHTANGLIRHVQVQNSHPHILQRVLKEGHELGLHGYDHYKWINGLENLKSKQIIALVRRGLYALTNVTKCDVVSFASPGFKVTPEFLRSIDSFNFCYSSDYKLSRPVAPFYPQLDYEPSRVLQIPVAGDSIGEMTANGYNEKEILSLLKFRMDVWYRNKVPFVIYVHPSYEVVYKFELLNNVVALINNDNRFKLSTLVHVSAVLEARA